MLYFLPCALNLSFHQFKIHIVELLSKLQACIYAVKVSIVICLPSWLPTWVVFHRLQGQPLFAFKKHIEVKNVQRREFV